MRQTLTLFEVLQLLGWSHSKFHRRRRLGRLPFQPLLREPGEHYEFARLDIETYLGHGIDVEAMDSEGITPVEEPEQPVEPVAVTYGR